MSTIQVTGSNSENQGEENTTVEQVSNNSTNNDAQIATNQQATNNYSGVVWHWEKTDLPQRTPKEIPTITTNTSSMNLNSPAEYFVEMFSHQNIQNICLETNRFILQNERTNIPSVKEEEIRKVLGLIIFMSQVKLPEHRHYWNGNYAQECVRTTMKVSRFEQILYNLHMNDNEAMPAKGTPEYDPLFKVRPLIANCQNSFGKLANIEERVSVDEMICPFKGLLLRYFDYHV